MSGGVPIQIKYPAHKLQTTSQYPSLPWMFCEPGQATNL